MNRESIISAIKKAKTESKTDSSNKKIIESNDDVFPSETFSFANSSWTDPCLIGEFASKSIVKWTKRDFLNFVKHLYFQKFMTDIRISLPYGYMYLSVIDDICAKNFPNSNVNILKAKYISWYFDRHILRDTARYRSSWNIKKMVSPKVIASFILEASGSTDVEVVSSKKVCRLPVNESLLEIYNRGDIKDFIKSYGIIVPFAYYFFSKKFSWEDCVNHISEAVTDFAEINPSNADKVLKKATELYAPYNKRYEKIAPERILAAITEKTGLNFTGVKIN